MDKKKAFDKSKNVVSLFLRVRWWFKVFLAFGTGVWTGMWTYRKVHVQPDWSKPGAIGFAILKGVVATAFTLLVLLAIRALIRLLIKSVKHMAAKNQKGGRTTEEVRPDEGNEGKCETREDIT